MVKELERNLGLIGVVAISISAMLGSGIFVLPGLAAAQTGPSVWLAYMVAGLCVVPAATCKAELATAMPLSGGSYVYLDRIFGPFFGTIAGVALWLSMLLKSAFALLGFGAYLLVLADISLVPTSLGFLALIVVLNVFGVRNVSRVQIVIVAAALLGLIGLIALGLSRVEIGRVSVELTHGPTGLLAAAGFVFVSYNGVTKVAAIAEEVHDPGRNLPLGILLSLAIVMVLYALVSFTLVGNLPIDELGSDLHPIYTLADGLGGHAAGIVAATLGVLTMVSMSNAGLLAASRFPFAMSRDQLLPAGLSTVSARFRTPVASIMLTGSVMAFAVAFLDVEQMAKLASAIVIMIYVAVMAAVVLFRESRVQWYQPAYRSPLYPWLHFSGILAGLILLSMLGGTVLVAALGVCVPGSIVYLLYGRRQTERMGVLGQRVKRSDLVREREPTVPVELGDTLRDDAGVVVSLFGVERSPEMLVELGSALSESHHVEVLDLTEVPEQVGVDAVMEEGPASQSLRRRLGAMAEETKTDVVFHSVISRDLARTIHAVTHRVKTEWLVMEWRGGSRRQLLPHNPIGWIINHLDVNLALFKDEGVRYVREILVYPEPGPNDSLVVGTADQLAAVWGARITLVQHVPDSATDAELQSAADYLGQVRALCGAPTREVILRGANRVGAVVDATASHDLLVHGSPDITIPRLLLGTTETRITARSACSVLTVKTPRGRTHEAFERRRASVTTPHFSVLEYLDARVLAARLQLSRKETLFQHIAKSFADVLETVPADDVLEAFWKRERSQNTSLGHGVALPHATLEEATRSVVGVFTTAEPMNYQGADGTPVDVFFVTAGPPGERHLHLELLSGIARLALKTDLLARLRSAETVEDIERALRDCDEAIARAGR